MNEQELRDVLRRVTLERDQARWTNDLLKKQNKSLRQDLRRERAEHRQTLLKLEAMEKNGGHYFPPAP